MEFPEENLEALSYWSNEEAAVEVALDMPTSRKGWELLETDMHSYFVGALRRRACEVRRRWMQRRSERLQERRRQRSRTSFQPRLLNVYHLTYNLHENKLWE